MTKISRVKKQKRQAAYRKSTGFLKNRSICVNCGEPGPHFIPPGFGMAGFFSCKKPDQTDAEYQAELEQRQHEYDVGRMTEGTFLNWLEKEKVLMLENWQKEMLVAWLAEKESVQLKRYPSDGPLARRKDN